MAQLRIFVSHSSHDNAWCRPFADALKAVGYDVWYDETGLQGGAAWVDSIQREVENRDVFLLVLTPEAWESKWVQDELQLAIATRRRVLPVLLHNTQVSGFLLTTQWITVIGEEPQAAARATLIAIEAPPAPGRSAAPQATTETLDELILLCRSLVADKRNTEALSACARALAIDPNNIDVLKIKASVLGVIKEPRVEGQTLFQILLINPNDEYIWSRSGSFSNYAKVFRNLTDEQELLQAHSLLLSSQRYARLNDSESNHPTSLLVEGLKRINRLDAVLAVWNNERPQLSALSDIPTLDIYAKALMEIGQHDDAKSAYIMIVHIFEDRFGAALRWQYTKRIFGADFAPPWGHGSYVEERACKYYLDSLDALGRSHYAKWLREAVRAWDSRHNRD